MAFVELKETTPLPDNLQVGTQYTIKGTVKIEGVIGAPPWVYARIQHHQLLTPAIVDSVQFIRGIPIPITGTFSINWTPTVDGVYTYHLIATPAPIAISTISGIADIVDQPILATTSPDRTVTTQQTVSASITGLTVVSYA